jgi:hypothetical protein
LDIVLSLLLFPFFFSFFLCIFFQFSFFLCFTVAFLSFSVSFIFFLSSFLPYFIICLFFFSVPFLLHRNYSFLQDHFAHYTYVYGDLPCITTSSHDLLRNLIRIIYVGIYRLLVVHHNQFSITLYTILFRRS